MASDPALERRFQKVFLNPPNIKETYDILKALRPGHERHHGVSISNLSLMLIIYLTNEHMRRRNQPDKAIITMDAAMAFQVKEHGKGEEVSLDSVYYMIGRETGLNKQALHDEKLIQRVMKHVKEVEGESVLYYI